MLFRSVLFVGLLGEERQTSFLQKKIHSFDGVLDVVEQGAVPVPDNMLVIGEVGVQLLHTLLLSKDLHLINEKIKQESGV